MADTFETAESKAISTVELLDGLWLYRVVYYFLSNVIKWPALH